jgi:hypothetical protein
LRQPSQFVFILAILIVLFKGADLLLRPHQQKRLKEQIETATLFLSYNQPLHVFAALSPLKLAEIIAPLALIMGMALFPHLIEVFSAVGSGYKLPFILALAMGYFAFRMAGRATVGLVSWMGFSSERNDRAVRKLLKSISVLTVRSLVSVAILVVGLCVQSMLGYAVLHLAFDRTPKVNLNLLRLATLSALPWLAFAITLFLTASFVVIACLWIIIFDGMMRICTALGWRIAEFEKGPVAAIASLATLVVALVQLAISH